MADNFTIPKFLQNEGKESVLARMLGVLPETISKEENGWVCDLFTPVAIEHARAIEYVLTEAVRNIIPKYSYGQFLLGHAENRGIVPHEATYAKAILKIKGVAGTKIPKGFQFSTASTVEESGILFQTEKEYEIPVSGEIEVEAICNQSGQIGNVAAEAIVLMAKPMKGIISIANPAPAYGGFEAETEESLRERVAAFDKEQGLSFVGSAADYKRWALEVEGVGDARIISAQDDSGTVTVVLTDANGQPAGEEICKIVENYIMRPDMPYERLAPINAKLLVVAADALKITVSVKVKLMDGFDLEQVRKAFYKNLTLYLLQNKDIEEIKYTAIGALLLQTDGITDYTDMILNEGIGNVAVNENYTPVVEDVGVVFL